MILRDEVVISVFFFDSQEVQAISSRKRKAAVRGKSRSKGTVISFLHLFINYAAASSDLRVLYTSLWLCRIHFGNSNKNEVSSRDQNPQTF